MRRKPRLNDYADQPQAFKTKMQDPWTENEIDHVVVIVLIACIVLFMVVNARCEDLPEAPKMGEHIEQPKLFSRENTMLFAANLGLRVADVTQTCVGLSNGGWEATLPTQHCAGVAGWVFAGIPAQIVGTWLLQRHGHPKLARAYAWSWPIMSAEAVAYTRARWYDKKR